MRYFLLLGVCCLFFACNTEVKKEKDPPQKTDISAVESMSNPSGMNSSLPRLFSNGNQLFMSWVTKQDSLATLFYSQYNEGQWQPPELITQGTDWFVNWADFPAIAENNGNILTNFLQKSADGTYTYDVKLNLYSEQEDSWNKNFILHDDGTKSEHGFVSMRPYAGNSFMVTWLDGRNTTGGHDAGEHGGGAMTLRGALVFEDGSIQYDTLLDDRVCDCCQTSTAIGPDDEILVAYRDRGEDEIRDISVVRWKKDTGWLEPQTVGNDQWKIAGCPVNGPSISTYQNSVAVAWFAAAKGNALVQVSFSDDMGETFNMPIRVDSGNAIGRVDIEMINETSAIVVWMEPKGEETVIQMTRVGMTSDDQGNVITIAKTSAERASGFPQLEIVGNTAYLAWTSIEEEGTKIETASVDMDKL